MTETERETQDEYSEIVCGDEGAIASSCEVRADNYFVSVITDECEGYAHMHVSVARKLRAALLRAIKHVEAMQPKP